MAMTAAQARQYDIEQAAIAKRFNEEAEAARNKRTQSSYNPDGSVSFSSYQVTPEQRATETGIRPTIAQNDNGGLTPELRDQIFKAQLANNAKMATNPQSAQPYQNGTYQPLVQQQAPQEQGSQIKSIEQIRQEIADKQKQLAVSNLQNSIEKQRQSLQAERQALAPVFQDQRRQAGVDDTMARQALTNMRVGQGLSGSGAMGQDAISQNVIQGNRLGSIAQTEGKAFADIGMREQSAERDFQMAVANANTQADLDNALEKYKLAKEAEEIRRQDALRAQDIARQDFLRAEGYNRQDYMTADERAYNASIRQEGYGREDVARQENKALDTKAEQEQTIKDNRNTELQTIGRYANDYQAEINKRQASPDPADDWLIPYLEKARMDKIATTKEDTFKNDLANINRYYSDFQAEINKRRAANPSDPLIPYLESARQQKIVAQQEATNAERIRLEKIANDERIRIEKEKATLKLKLTPTPKASTPKTTPKTDPNNLGFLRD